MRKNNIDNEAELQHVLENCLRSRPFSSDVEPSKNSRERDEIYRRKPHFNFVYFHLFLFSCSEGQFGGTTSLVRGGRKTRIQTKWNGCRGRKKNRLSKYLLHIVTFMINIFSKKRRFSRASHVCTCRLWSAVKKCLNYRGSLKKKINWTFGSDFGKVLRGAPTARQAGMQ